jgi:hypothetical protein
MLIGLAVLGLIVLVAAPAIVAFITPGFDAAQTATTVELTRIMILSPIFLALGSVATSVLNAGGRFAASAIAPVTYNLAIIGAALLLAPSMGVEGLAIGVVLGSLTHLLVQLRPLARLGFRYVPAIDVGDVVARKALTLMAPRAIGLGASQITFVVVTSLATLQGPGAVTSFNVAFTLLQIPIGVIGVPLGIVVLPSLSRVAAVGREPEFVSMLTRALRLLVYVMVPIGALFAIVRVETVSLLFDDGSYDGAALALTASTLFASSSGWRRAHRGAAARALPREDTLRWSPRGGRGRRQRVSLRSVLSGCLVAGRRPRYRHRRLAGGHRPIANPGPAAWRFVAMALGGRRAGPQPSARSSRGGWAGRAGLLSGDRVRPGQAPPCPGDRGDQRRLRPRLRRGLARLADPGTAVYRRGHGRRAPPPATVVTDAAGPTEPRDLTRPSAWDAFVEASEPGSYLQLSAWAG